MPGRVLRTSKLDLRLTPEAKEKLQAAAKAAHRSVSEFVLESAIVRADETLAGRTRFGLDADRWQMFLSALDAPPREIPRLARLFQEPGPLEDGMKP
ncbi:MAG: type II toxin-antitoxin system TacA family antitoxin [Isosphaeraceae bacterium]